jgi:glycosyltransferase involved in cell wall biosynthesis
MLSDARWQGLHGIGRFAREVLRRLPEHSLLEKGPKPLSAADPIWLTYQVMTRRPPVFFSPGFNPPPLCFAPFVFTIHDLIQIQLPDVATPAKRLYYRLVLRPACRQAFRVLTVSEYSRAQIVEWSGVPEERVVNVGNGISLPFRPEGLCYRPGFPYVLYVGNSRPHKNLDRLLLAFRGLNHSGLRLVVVGRRDSALAARLDKLELRNRTEFMGSLPDEELASVYRGAALLALPSLIEGFGLPALEALACGTPVVVSRAAALPEVVGRAGLSVDPFDVEDIRQNMERVLCDRALRTSLRTLGLERARQFSWDRVAAKVRAVLDEAAENC